MISVIAWVIAIGAWLVIVLGPFALVVLASVPRCRRWWMRPVQRRRAARRERARVMAQARRDARIAELEAEMALDLWRLRNPGKWSGVLGYLPDEVAEQATAQVLKDTYAPEREL
jgi:hypothetical protein